MSAASENLRSHQEQADMDGIMVKVSRQAVDETLAEYDAMLKALLDIVEVDDRDSRTDPDIAATDEWRAQVITNARAAVAKARG